MSLVTSFYDNGNKWYAISRHLPSEQVVFGGGVMHLIVDGYGGNVDVMQDHEALFRFLDEYPDAIGMTKITSPQVYTYNGQNLKIMEYLALCL